MWLQTEINVLYYLGEDEPRSSRSPAVSSAAPGAAVREER